MSLSEKLFNAGVVGAGGGGFPTHVKAKSQVEYILANGAECEPLIHKDVEIMVNHAEEIIDGMNLMVEATGADQAKFGIKSKNQRAIVEINKEIENTKIELCEFGDFYPSGDEYELVYEATKRLIPPKGIPLDVGCVVNNVETFYNVSQANKGIPVTKKFVCVTGAIKNPATFFVPVGTTYRELIEYCGGTTIDDFGIMVSGILMGSLTFNLDDVVTKTCAGIIILPKEHYLISRYNRDIENMNRIGKSACDQCSYCTELCPRYLLGYDVQPHKVMRSLEFSMQGEDYWSQFADLCCSCGLCTLYSCPEDLYPREACDQSKIRLKENNMTYEQKKEVKVHPIKEGRRVPITQLMKKLNLIQFNYDTPCRNDFPEPSLVKIPLQQHIGAKAESVVSAGQNVSVGDLIADIPQNTLGARIHASISGKVSEINEDFIVIKK